MSLEHSLTLVGAQRFTIAPNGNPDLLGVVSLRIRPGGLREDTQEIPGQDGATRTVLGYADAELTAEITIWDESQMEKIKRLGDLFRPRREQKTYQPVSIVHPSANRWGIRQVYIFAIEQSPWTSKNGATITLSMREWRSREQRKTKQTKPISVAAANTSGIPDGIDIAAPSRTGAPRP